MIYNIFISHSWAYGEQYYSLIRLLNSDPHFAYRDYSIPKHDPIHNVTSDRMLKDAIRKQMQHASCVLILAGVYSNYSRWINFEIEAAQEMEKRIIAVEYWGAERTSLVVKRGADYVVRWNANSIISAIRRS